MHNFFEIGACIWMIGAGVKGIPGTGLAGSVIMIVGGVVSLIGVIG